MRIAFLHLFLCATCFLAFAQQDDDESPGLQPGDQVRIRPGTANHALGRHLRHDLTVDDTGRITLPGPDLELNVLGLQATRAAILIQSALRSASGLPKLNLTVLSSRNGLPLPEQHCLTIEGEVAEPGLIPYRPPMTLADSLAAVGGTTTLGATKRVKLYRGGDLFTYDLADPAHAALLLWPHDIIEVPARLWASR